MSSGPNIQLNIKYFPPGKYLSFILAVLLSPGVANGEGSVINGDASKGGGPRRVSPVCKYVGRPNNKVTQDILSKFANLEGLKDGCGGTGDGGTALSVLAEKPKLEDPIYGKNETSSGLAGESPVPPSTTALTDKLDADSNALVPIVNGKGVEEGTFNTLEEFKNPLLDVAIETNQSNPSGLSPNDLRYDADLISRAYTYINTKDGDTKKGKFTYEEASTAKDPEVKAALQVLTAADMRQKNAKENIIEYTALIGALTGEIAKVTQNKDDLRSLPSNQISEEMLNGKADRDSGGIATAFVQQGISSSSDLSSIKPSELDTAVKNLSDIELKDAIAKEDAAAKSGRSPASQKQRASVKERLMRELASREKAQKDLMAKGKYDGDLPTAFNSELAAAKLASSETKTSESTLSEFLGGAASKVLGKEQFPVSGADTDNFIQARANELEGEIQAQAGILASDGPTIFKRVTRYYRACSTRATCLGRK